MKVQIIGKTMKCQFNYEGICNLTNKKCDSPKNCPHYKEEYVPKQKESNHRGDFKGLGNW